MKKNNHTFLTTYTPKVKWERIQKIAEKTCEKNHTNIFLNFIIEFEA